MNKDLVFFGIQGSGKGTQGKILAERHGMGYFEMGGELRKLAAENSDLGRKVKSIIDAGHLVPTGVVMEIVENYLTHLSAGQKSIIDGIPRSDEQAKAFDVVMKKLGREFLGVHITLPRDVALNRLLNRRICSGCKKAFIAAYKNDTCDNCGGTLARRADDTRESIETRLDTFERETVPIITHYEKAGLMIATDGDQPIEKITADLEEKISI